MPLILRGALPQGVLDGPVDHTDVATTLAQLISGAMPAGFEGRSLLSPQASDRAFFAVADMDWVDAAAVPTEPAAVYSRAACWYHGRKITYDVPENTYKWFDLNTDPAEALNLSPTRDIPVDLLHAFKKSWDSASPIKASRSEQETIEKSMADLGYLP